MLFGLFDDDRLVAAANLTSGPDAATDVGLVLRPKARGQGLRRPDRGDGDAHAIRMHGVARFRALWSSPATMAIAAKLGFTEYGRNIAVYLHGERSPTCRAKSDRRQPELHDPMGDVRAHQLDADALAQRQLPRHRARTGGSSSAMTPPADAPSAIGGRGPIHVEHGGVEVLAHPSASSTASAWSTAPRSAADARRRPSASRRAARATPPYPVGYFLAGRQV